MQYAQNIISCFKFPTIEASAYTRGDGYWSNSGDEKDQTFFGQLTNVNSQRENWYEKTPYVAEFWCTVSNVVIIGAGVLSDSPELVFAGTASAVSHAIPKEWLLKVDKLGAGLVALKVLSEYQAIISDPKLIILPLAAAAIHNADVILARTQGHKWSHVVWHCASGAFVGYFLKAASSMET